LKLAHAGLDDLSRAAVHGAGAGDGLAQPRQLVGILAAAHGVQLGLDVDQLGAVPGRNLGSARRELDALAACKTTAPRR
jgi:hypothetical protein